MGPGWFLASKLANKVENIQFIIDFQFCRFPINDVIVTIFMFYYVITLPITPKINPQKPKKLRIRENSKIREIGKVWNVDQIGKVDQITKIGEISVFRAAKKNESGEGVHAIFQQFQ